MLPISVDHVSAVAQHGQALVHQPLADVFAHGQPVEAPPRAGLEQDVIQPDRPWPAQLDGKARLGVAGGRGQGELQPLPGGIAAHGERFFGVDAVTRAALQGDGQEDVRLGQCDQRALVGLAAGQVQPPAVEALVLNAHFARVEANAGIQKGDFLALPPTADAQDAGLKLSPGRAAAEGLPGANFAALAQVGAFSAAAKRPAQAGKLRLQALVNLHRRFFKAFAKDHLAVDAAVDFVVDIFDASAGQVAADWAKRLVGQNAKGDRVGHKVSFYWRGLYRLPRQDWRSSPSTAWRRWNQSSCLSQTRSQSPAGDASCERDRSRSRGRLSQA